MRHALAGVCTLAVAGALLVGGPVPSQAAGETVTTVTLNAGSAPEGVAVAADGTAYTANRDSNTSARVPVGAAAADRYFPTRGRMPYSVTVNSSGLVYVTNRGSGDLTRIDPSRPLAVPTLIPVAVGSEPWGITTTPDDTVFATTNQTDMVLRVNRGSAVVNATIPLLAGSEPKDIEYSPVEKRLYVADSGNHTVARIDPDTGAVQYIPLAVTSSLRGIAVATDGYVYVTDIGNDQLFRIAPGAAVAESVALFPPASFPADVAADPDGSVLVALSTPAQVLRYRGTTLEATIDLGLADGGPDRVAVGKDGVAYTANFGGDSVSRIDPGPRPLPSPTVTPDPTASPTPGPTPSPTPSPTVGPAGVVATTFRAAKIHRKTAVLRGRVTAGKSATKVRMRIARNAQLTAKPRVLSVRTIKAGATRTVRKAVTGLKRHKAYWYRVEGVVGSAAATGSIRKFHTK